MDEDDSQRPLISYTGDDESPGPSHIDSVMDSPANNRFAPISPVATKSPIKKPASKKQGTIVSSVVNLCATAMGAGVLSLPHALANTGGVLGVCLIYGFAIAADMSCVMLVACSRACHHYSLEGVARHYLGEKGYWTVNIALLLLLYGALVLMEIVVMDLLPPVVQSATGSTTAWYSQRLFVGMIAVSTVFPLNLLKSLTALKFTSGAALCFLAFFVSVLWARFFQKMKSSGPIAGCVGNYSVGTACYGLCGPKSGANFAVSMGDQCFFPFPNHADTADHCQIGGSGGENPLSIIGSPIEMIQTKEPQRIILSLPLILSAFLCQFNIMSIDHELNTKSKPYIGRVIHIAIVGIAATIYTMGGMLGYVINGKCVANNLLKDFHADNVMTAVRAAIGMTNLFKIPLLLVPLRTTSNEILSNIKGLEGLTKPSDFFIVVETLVIYVVVFISAYELKSISKDLDLLGCTAGACVLAVMPGLLYKEYLKEQRRAKVEAALEEEEYAEDATEFGPWHDFAAWFMLIGGVAVGVSGLAITLIFWDDA